MGAIKYGLILAAGEGVRMRPLTDYYPKIGLPILNKPLLAHHLELINMIGIEKLCIIVSDSNKKDILRIIDISGYRNIDCNLIIQKEKRGTGHAVLQAERFLDGQRFLLLLGDEYYNDTDSLLSLKETGAEMAIGVIEYNSISDISAGCNVHIENNYISKLEEKPSEDQIRGKWCWDGSAVLSSSIFLVLNQMLKDAGSTVTSDVCLVKAMQFLVETGNRLGIVRKKGVNINLTNDEDFVLTNMTEYRKVYGDAAFKTLLNKLS